MSSLQPDEFSSCEAHFSPSQKIYLDKLLDLEHPEMYFEL